MQRPRKFARTPYCYILSIKSPRAECFAVLCIEKGFAMFPANGKLTAKPITVECLFKCGFCRKNRSDERNKLNCIDDCPDMPNCNSSFVNDKYQRNNR